MKNVTTYRKFRDLYDLMGSLGRRYLLLLVLAKSGPPIIDISLAFSLKLLADYFIKDTQESIYYAVLVGAFLLIIGCVFLPFISYLSEKQQIDILRSIKLKVIKHIQKLPTQYFEKQHSGSMISELNRNIESVRSAMEVISRIIWGGMGLLFVVPYIMGMEWSFGIIALIAAIIASIINMKFIIPIRERGMELHENTSELAEIITENISGFTLIKMYSLYGVFMRKLIKKLSKVTGYSVKSAKLIAAVIGSNVFISLASSGLMAIVGVFMVSKGVMETGALIGTIPVCASISFCIICISRNLTTVQRHFVGVDKLKTILAEEIEPIKYQTGDIGHSAGILIKNAVFGYNIKCPIINILNLEVPKGKSAALVGDSGGGKSTIMKIIMGIYELWEGDMVLNGKAISEYSLSEMRGLSAYVPQDAYLFAGTIRENIQFGRIESTKEEVIIAAKKANAHNFITKQLKGYETLVGERGVRLSGGQRQRIAIARAILKDSPVLLLDEATSNLDSISEKLIQESLDKLMVNKTCVICAHRLSTIKNADIIFFIKDGKVAEEGSHEELLVKNGFYAELYKKEFVIST